MNFPGTCELSINDAAIMAAIEDALNASRLQGEDRIRVTSMRHSYGSQPWAISITTDAPAAPEVATLKVAA